MSAPLNFAKSGNHVRQSQPDIAFSKNHEPLALSLEICLVRRGRERGVPFFPYGTARSHDTEKKVDLARQIKFWYD